MNEFLAFDDAEWELASAYLDNEVTLAERAQVEASPALMGLVADLRSMQSSITAPAPTAIDRDAMIAAAIARAVEEPIIGRVAGSGDTRGSLPPPQAVSPVASIASARLHRARFGRAPMLLAAGLVTVMGIGFAVRAGSRRESVKTAGAATSSAAAAKSTTQDQSTGSIAAAPVSTESLASVPTPAGAATTAAAAAPAATTAAAAPATTAAPANATTAAPVALSSTTVASSAAGPTTTAAGPPVPPLTLQELKDLVVASATNPAAVSTLVCPDPHGVPRLSVQIVWKGQPAVVYIDQVSQTLVVLAVNGCAPVANIPIKDLGQS